MTRAALVLGLLLAGCGVEGPPVRPEPVGASVSGDLAVGVSLVP